MLIRSALLLLALIAAPAQAQSPLPFATFAQFTDSLATIGGIGDADERDAALDALWADLIAAEQVPFALGDSAAFLYRGSASSLAVAGDLNGWNPSAGPLGRVGLSDVWMRVYRFPGAARLDYKLVRSGTWILDPANPHQQWSGFGPNSELRMPAWVFPAETVRDPQVPAGAFTPNLSLASAALGYTVRYRVYTPPGYDDLSNLPVVYVTDGHEYADDRLGAFRIVLDNLIAEGRAEPAIAVFIDPRVNGQNRRQEQYVQNPDFAAFVADELVPAVDAAYRTRTDRDGRVILGTSLGGLFSAYLGLLHPDTFGKLAIQSPAFWVSEQGALGWEGPSIYTLVAEAEDGLFDVYMSTGTINDTEDGARQMRTVFESNDHALVYREVPEGHSWGNWRALLDEMLAALLPATATDAEDSNGAVPDLRLTPYPNPARDSVTFQFALDAPSPVALRCYDLGGRLVADLAGGAALPAGPHTVAVDAERIGAAGVYVCRLSDGERTASRLVTLVN
ncbi:MAG: alpha/beta hydrolase-fold protein [Rhodothermales bacterium]